jgi:hypothetical protein
VPRGVCLVAVVLDVRLGRLRCMMHGVLVVPVCGVRVMRRRQMIAGLVVFCGFAMVPGRVLVMFRCAMVMLSSLIGHRPS